MYLSQPEFKLHRVAEDELKYRSSCRHLSSAGVTRVLDISLPTEPYPHPQ